MDMVVSEACYTRGDGYTLVFEYCIRRSIQRRRRYVTWETTGRDRIPGVCFSRCVSSVGAWVESRMWVIVVWMEIDLLSLQLWTVDAFLLLLFLHLCARCFSFSASFVLFSILEGEQRRLFRSNSFILHVF